MIKQLIKKIVKSPWTVQYTPSVQKSFCNNTVTGGSVSGKSVVISGATGDIGDAMVRRFLTEGCSLILIGRSEEKLKKMLKKYSAEYKISMKYLVLDLLEPEEIVDKFDAYLKKVDCVDVLINNAGVFGGAREKQFKGVSEENFLQTININLQSASLLSEIIINKMLDEERRGTIVNISSICSQFNSFRYSPYGISKAGLIGLTKDINRKYGGNSIVAHSILPGTVATKMGHMKIGDNIAGNNNILNRPALPEEIAAIAAICASDIGKYCETDIVASAGENL